MTGSPQDVLTFWFHEHSPAQWFASDIMFDQKIKQRFSTTHQSAVLGELSLWRKTPHGRLAEIIILDQFSRNIHRNTAKAFSADGMALILAQEAIACGAHNALSQKEKWVLYLPYMHSESAVIHDQAVALFTDLALPEVLKFEMQHKAIIDQFGRYPHRNKQLGRHSTPEEETFLKQPNSGF